MKEIRGQNSRRAMTLIEMTVVLLLLPLAILCIVELFITVQYRGTLVALRQSALRGPERFVAEFNTALQRAESVSLYPNRSSSPNFPSTSGNFLVFRFSGSSSLEFELESGELRLNGPPADGWTQPLVCAADVWTDKPPVAFQKPLFTHRDGVLTLEFFASAGLSKLAVRPSSERVSFTASGRIASMR